MPKNTGLRGVSALAARPWREVQREAPAGGPEFQGHRAVQVLRAASSDSADTWGRRAAGAGPLPTAGCPSFRLAAVCAACAI